MKKVLAVLLQFIVFFALFAVFSFLQPFGVHWFVSHPSPAITRYFVADGFIVATAAMLATLLIEALMKSIRRAGLLTVLSYVAAVAIGFAVKLGFITHDLMS